MAKKKKKWYVVWKGHTPGIYTTWDEASAQVNGYSGAKYKSFGSRAEAEAAFKGSASSHISSGKPKKAVQATQMGFQDRASEVIWESIAVDAACSGNPGDLEYRGVDLSSGEQIFIRGPFAQGTNNIGEFLGIVHGLNVLKSKGLDKTPIYTDSRTAISWVKKRKANTSLRQTPANRTLFELVEQAEQWLKENSYSNPILKWDTGRWGEIPADFGRK
ncbi:MAG: ribonuclease H family protein [Chloroflexota bacterium]